MAEDRWLPIATAPKDGSLVWLAVGDDMRLAKWREGRWLNWLDDAEDPDFHPTHWHSLPETPKP